MTPWQESCITALASSPLAFEAFKMKQKNKKVLDQYMSRIWKTFRLNSDEQKGKITDNIKYKLTELLSTKFDSPFTFVQPVFPISFTFNISYSEIIKKIFEFLLQNRSKYAKLRRSNYFCEIVLLLYEKKLPVPTKMITCFNEHYMLLNFLSTISNLKITGITIVDIIPHSGRTYSAEKTKLLIEELEFLSSISTIKSKKEKQKKLTLNIGIEIEHDAIIGTNDKIQRKILQQGCVSYDSGFDGDNTGRLRENRIRLNGYKGLKGLYTLLQYMQEYNSIARNSSVHMHIDARIDNTYSTIYRRINDYDIDVCFTDKIQALTQLNRIFDFNASTFDFYSENIRLQSEFKTIEFRFCKVNFNYTDYVIQILALIHWKECFAFGKPCNLRYLRSLADIQQKIHNKYPTIINQ